MINNAYNYKWTKENVTWVLEPAVFVCLIEIWNRV